MSFSKNPFLFHVSFKQDKLQPDYVYVTLRNTTRREMESAALDIVVRTTNVSPQKSNGDLFPRIVEKQASRLVQIELERIGVGHFGKKMKKLCLPELGLSGQVTQIERLRVKAKMGKDTYDYGELSHLDYSRRAAPVSVSQIKPFLPFALKNIRARAARGLAKVFG